MYYCLIYYLFLWGWTYLEVFYCKLCWCSSCIIIIIITHSVFPAALYSLKHSNRVSLESPVFTRACVTPTHYRSESITPWTTSLSIHPEILNYECRWSITVPADGSVSASSPSYVSLLDWASEFTLCKHRQQLYHPLTQISCTIYIYIKQKDQRKKVTLKKLKNIIFIIDLWFIKYIKCTEWSKKYMLKSNKCKIYKGRDMLQIFH